MAGSGSTLPEHVILARQNPSRRRTSISQPASSITSAPVIDRRYPLSEVPDAIRYLETMRAKGKVVITI
jgi:NADPH:quinone reductase-like Zn-dependent oxidoreductase